MGDHGQRVPVAQHNGCKRPLDVLEAYSRLNVIIFSDVSRIIKINKIVVYNPSEGDTAGNNQENDDEISSFLILIHS